MESKATTIAEAAAEFRNGVTEWNSTAEERRSTRTAMRAALQEMGNLIADAKAAGGSINVGEAAAGGLVFVAEAMAMLTEQVGMLEERLEALEEER